MANFGEGLSLETPAEAEKRLAKQRTENEEALIPNEGGEPSVALVATETPAELAVTAENKAAEDAAAADALAETIKRGDVGAEKGESVADKIAKAEDFDALLSILNNTKEYDSPQAGKIVVDSHIQREIYEIGEEYRVLKHHLSAKKEGFDVDPRIYGRVDELSIRATNLEPHLQNKVRALLKYE